MNLCLEVKLSKSTDKIKSMVDEINADIRAYSKKYERQTYVIYDLGTIRDEAEFKRDLEAAPGVSVVVVEALTTFRWRGIVPFPDTSSP